MIVQVSAASASDYESTWATNGTQSSVTPRCPPTRRALWLSRARFRGQALLPHHLSHARNWEGWGGAPPYSRCRSPEGCAPHPPLAEGFPDAEPSEEPAASQAPKQTQSGSWLAPRPRPLLFLSFVTWVGFSFYGGGCKLLIQLVHGLDWLLAVGNNRTPEEMNPRQPVLLIWWTTRA